MNLFRGYVVNTNRLHAEAKFVVTMKGKFVTTSDDDYDDVRIVLRVWGQEGQRGTVFDIPVERFRKLFARAELIQLSARRRVGATRFDEKEIIQQTIVRFVNEESYLPEHPPRTKN